MSASDETPTPRAVAEAGKDICGASQSFVDGVHPAPATRPELPPMLPHLPYGDAVHVHLADAGLAPDVVDAGLRREAPDGPAELYLTLSWLPGHPDLDGPMELELAWSHLTGWSARTDDSVHTLDVDHLADAVLHHAVHGTHRAWVIPFLARWTHADALTAALKHAAEEGVIA